MLEKIDEFSAYLLALGAANNTAVSYARDLRQFAAWLSDSFPGTDIADISQILTERYIEELEDSGRSTATVSRYITAFRRFFAWAFAKGYVFNNPAAHLKSPKVMRKSPAAVSMSDIERLINAAEGKSAKCLRDTAMLRLMGFAGIGAAELLMIRLSDVELKKKSILVGSAHKRVLTVDKKTATIVKRYVLKGRPMLLKELTAVDHGAVQAKRIIDDSSDSGLLFINCGGGRMSRQGLWKNIRYYSEAAGLAEPLTPEILRHSYAVNAIRSGESAFSVQEKLGHITDSSVIEYMQIAKKYDKY